jgi:hypothetical protein
MLVSSQSVIQPDFARGRVVDHVDGYNIKHILHHERFVNELHVIGHIYDFDIFYL